MEEWFEKIREKWMFLGAGLLIILCGAGFLLYQNGQKNAEEVQDTEEMTVYSEESSVEEKAEDIYVDIKGAVHAPGMYKIKPESRLIEAVETAGGFTAEADQNQLNFALKLEDQQVVYVPKKGETAEETAPAADGQAQQAEDPDKININTATETELQELSGIGEKKARDIIAYREANGSFKDISELTNISGIGEKTVEKIRDYITI